MQALVIRISRDGNVLNITVNFMLNKRISKKAAGAKPQTPLGELSALPQTLLLSREGARPLPYPPPVVNIFIRPPLFQNPRSAPVGSCNLDSKHINPKSCTCPEMNTVYTTLCRTLCTLHYVEHCVHHTM